jgi:hypothetical protein
VHACLPPRMLRLSDCWRDLGALLRLATGAASLRPDAPASTPSRFFGGGAWTAAALRNAVVALGVIYVGGQILLQIYPQEGVATTVRAWFRAPAPSTPAAPISEPPASSPGPASPSAEMNPYLLQAAREYVAPTALTLINAANGTLGTDWSVSSSEPNARRKYQITIGKELPSRRPFRPRCQACAVLTQRFTHRCR